MTETMKCPHCGIITKYYPNKKMCTKCSTHINRLLVRKRKYEQSLIKVEKEIEDFYNKVK